MIEPRVWSYYSAVPTEPATVQVCFVQQEASEGTVSGIRSSDMAGEGTVSGGGAELMEPAPAPALALVPVTATATERKPRGRPLGSKNKPKPPVVVTRESEAAMRPVVLELEAGCDVVSAVAAFARRRHVGVSVLCGRGAVAAVTLRLVTAGTATASASAVTLHGRFEMLALSGTVLPSSSPSLAPAFSVSLAGVGGQVIGGTLAGEMTAADGVVLVAAVFGGAEVHRLPAAGAEDRDGGGGGGGREEGRHPQPLMQVAVSGADVAGLGGGGGHVGQHAEQLSEIGLWGQQPTPTRGPVRPLHRF